MTRPNDEQIKQAFNRVLDTVVGQHHARETTTLQDDPNRRLIRCVERVQAEASEGADPHRGEHGYRKIRGL